MYWGYLRLILGGVKGGEGIGQGNREKMARKG